MKIKLGKGGYRTRQEGEVCDLGKEKNAELIKLGRATLVREVKKRTKKDMQPAKRTRTYKTK